MQFVLRFEVNFFRFVSRSVFHSIHVGNMSDDLEDNIRDNAKAPARASNDSGSMEQHNLKDQIEADKYLASKAATKSKTRGLRFNKLVPPSAG